MICQSKFVIIDVRDKYEIRTFERSWSMKTMEKQPMAAAESFVLRRQIGSTTYRVGIYFNPNAKETLNDKVCRLLKNDLQTTPGNGTMESLQAGCLSERGTS